MNFGEHLLKFITSFLSEPSILVGLFAMVGLIVQKAKPERIISGTFKTILGFLLISAGATILISSLDFFNLIFEKAFNITGVIPTNEAITAEMLDEYGTITAIIMMIAMFFNIVVAKFTRFKYIFLTGHHTLFMSALLSAVFLKSGMPGYAVVLLAGPLLGVLMSVMPAIIQPYTKEILGNDTMAIGHFGTIGYFTAGTIGKYLGNKEKTTENMNVPKSLNFLRDPIISIALTTTIMYIIVAAIAGPNWLQNELYSQGINTSWIVYSLMQAFTFAAGVWVIMQGVKMLISEIVPSFKGIADKFIKDAKPALDIPIIFPFAPNAVIIGFLASFSIGLICLFIMPSMGLAAVVPGLVPHFFTGAGAAVYGNATGGRRGAILGAMANGLLISFLPALLIPIMESLGYTNSTFGDTDFATIGIIIGSIATELGPLPLYIGIPIIIALPFLVEFGLFIFKKKNKLKNPDIKNELDNKKEDVEKIKKKVVNSKSTTKGK